MKQRVARLALVLGFAGAVGALSVGCGTEDDSATPPIGGAGGKAGSTGTAGAGNNGGSGGSNAGSGNESGSAGDGGPAGSAGDVQGGASGAAGDHGVAGDHVGGSGGEGGEGAAAGAGSVYTAEQIARGNVIVRSEALCSGCHAASLGGNATFPNVPAPNLTNDATGIGEWTDQEVMNAIRNGVDDEGRHLNPVMPYWLFHNMSDADALSVVAYLRSVPPVVAAIGTANPEVAAVTPLAPSSLPDTTLASTDPDYAAALRGKYLVSGVAQCVRCHSPAGQPPTAGFFSGVAPTSSTQIFASNITPDVTTGIGGWTVADVVTALKVGTNKDGRTLCGSMPSAAKGYGGMSDADARAIGVYLTTIPAVSKPAADPDLQPACPAPPP